MPPDTAKPVSGSPAEPRLEVRIAATGEDLLSAISRVLDAIPDPPSGPQALARRLGVDKVLASRLLKAVKAPDPVSVINRAPGPDPLRRVVKAAGKQGVDAALIRTATEAIDRFERLIRDEIGDRASLDAIVSAWVPEARREFELRRKQSLFKALSHLKGAHAESITATVFLAPAADGKHLDIVWLNGLFGLTRLRPGAAIKFATRRFASDLAARKPQTLAGREVEDQSDLLLAEYCSRPTPTLRAHPVGEIVHYTLDSTRFGPASAVDLVHAEVNRSEMKRTVPAGSGRKAYVFAEVSTPAKVLQFDAFVHESVYPGATPRLRIYDTAFEGVADVNNPARDIDALDVLESISPLPNGMQSCRSAVAPRYVEMLDKVCTQMHWKGEEFRGYRCRIEYPIYGAQVTMLFDPPSQ
ncbi:MAG: hypothetical protein KDA16_12250 [Phycisphaerales bacterium]|nr:hypothetical protein [Phycisphaerales bacterium]